MRHFPIADPIERITMAEQCETLTTAPAVRAVVKAAQRVWKQWPADRQPTAADLTLFAALATLDGATAEVEADAAHPHEQLRAGANTLLDVMLRHGVPGGEVYNAWWALRYLLDGKSADGQPITRKDA